MVIPEPFEVHAPEGTYLVEFDVDSKTDTFPIVCHPNSLKREIIRFLNTVPDGASYFINALLIQPLKNTNEVTPLMVRIWFEEHDLDIPMEEESLDKSEWIMHFSDFIDQLLADGEKDYFFPKNWNEKGS